MVAAKLNRAMIGWANYFCLGPASKAYRAVEKHASKSCVNGCVPSTKRCGRGPSGFRRYLCTKCWALSALPSGRAISRGRPRDPFSESRKREIRTSGSMSGMCKRKHGEAIDAPADERAGNR
jgi:Group II intron, maturase-specific domain